MRQSHLRLRKDRKIPSMSYEKNNLHLIPHESFLLVFLQRPKPAEAEWRCKSLTYQIIQNLFLSILLSGLFYNTVIYNEIIHKNYVDIFAIIGGNISLFSSIQSVFNRMFNRFFLTISTPTLKSKKDDDDIDIIVL